MSSVFHVDTQNTLRLRVVSIGGGNISILDPVLYIFSFCEFAKDIAVNIQSV